MTKNNSHEPYIIVLGTIQDGGFTYNTNSKKQNCQDTFEKLKISKKLVQ